MKNAGKFKDIFEKIKQELPEKKVVGEAGGGMVAVQMNGKQEVLGVFIDDSIKDEEKAVLETLVASAANQAVKKTHNLVKEEVKKSFGEIDMPEISNLMNFL